jgi:hypothetical protein
MNLFMEKNGVFRVHDLLSFGRIAHKYGAFFCKCHNRRSRPETLVVRDYQKAPVFHDAHAGICRTKVDADYL